MDRAYTVDALRRSRVAADILAEEARAARIATEVQVNRVAAENALRRSRIEAEIEADNALRRSRLAA